MERIFFKRFRFIVFFSTLLIISGIYLTGAKLNSGIDIGYYNGPGFSLYITSDSIPSKRIAGFAES